MTDTAKQGLPMQLDHFIKNIWLAHGGGKGWLPEEDHGTVSLPKTMSTSAKKRDYQLPCSL